MISKFLGFLWVESLKSPTSPCGADFFGAQGFYDRGCGHVPSVGCVAHREAVPVEEHHAVRQVPVVVVCVCHYIENKIIPK